MSRTAQLRVVEPPPEIAPRPRGLVARPRLVRRLADAEGVAVVALVAPAGYGKTTLLREWATTDDRRFEWLDPEDLEREPARLLEWFARARAGSVLVLDDAHAVRSSAALRALKSAGRRACAHAMLVVASRTEPSLPLARLRAEGAVVELRAHDLALSEREATRLLNGCGASLSGVDVGALIRAAEGWPAGLRLGARSLGEQHAEGVAAARVGGEDRFMADYLRDEMLVELDAGDLDFARRTSVLGELSGPLCDAVLGETGSGLALQRLARANVLLRPLDHCEERFRWHPLLGDLLRAELRRADAGAEQQIHLLASDWHEQHGDPVRAVEHAIDARDLDRAAELMWDEVSASGGSACANLCARWAASLHDRQIASRPALALSVSIGSVLRGDGETALRWVEVGERLLARAPAATLPSLRAGAAVIRALLATGSVAAMTDAAARALAVAPGDSPWRATACLLAGAGHHVAGERARARRELEEGAARAAVCAPTVRATCLAQLALMALEDEDWDQATELCERAREIAGHADADALRGCVLVLAASAFVHAHHGDAERARDDVLEARRRLTRFPERWPWYDAEARVALARAELRLSDAAGARTLLTEASRALRAVPDAPVLRGWIDDAWERADTFAVEAFAGPATLTTAELRVLRFLPSHMSFRELATRLHVSTNTVKTQAHAVYRKLDASSRSEAVARARDVGLIDA